ncbi:MAG: stage II sporulation protein P [Clostridia bacterium]|nr:stage II sporulation protein P [Clostridia bacterium]
MKKFAKRVKLSVKRTNTLDEKICIAYNIFMSIILAFLLLIGDSTPITEKILLAGLYLTFPEKILQSQTETNSTVFEQQNFSNSENSSQVSSVTNSSVPKDVQMLMKNAEKKYADSPKDGLIIESDYSKQNATSEFNGIYLRNTTLNHKVNISDYVNKKVYASVDVSQPTVLIYHTHSTETYELLDRGYYTKARSSLSQDKKENMIRVGKEICKVLEKNGYKTIHDKTVYDEEYNGAYNRSFEGVKNTLKNNPSIQIVLDIHRGTIYQKDGSRIKTVTEIDGKKIAQIQIISGCEDGNVTDFPNWEKNFAFAVKLQKQLADTNSKLVRPLLLCSRKYNMHLMPCALQIEIGTDANTLLEAVYSAEFFAESLSQLLKEYEI